MAKLMYGDIRLKGNKGILFEDGDGTDNIITLKAPTNVSANIAFALPASITASGALVSDGSGNLSTSLLANANIDASAAIALSKLAAVTASRALVSDGSGFVSASAVTATELGYVSGVTSAIQTQIDGKAGTALSNLASVAINTSLISDTDNTDDLGSAAIGWANGYINKVLFDSNSQTTTIAGSASASASVDYTLPAAAPGGNGYLLASTTGGAMSWVAPSGVSSFTATWVNADTATKAVSHSLGTTDVMVQVYDIDSGETIDVDTVDRTDANTVTLTASEAPDVGGSGWKVLILDIA